MAILSNKLYLKHNNKTYACECYTTIDEATPVENGTVWRIINNNITCYIGLQIEGKTKYDTPLQIEKNSIVYSVQSKVVNTRKVVIKQTPHQTIKVSYNGKIYTYDFIAKIGEAFSVTVEADKGYIAGKPNISSGYIPNKEEDYTIEASPATKDKYQVTIIQTPHQTIKVICNDIEYTSNFQADYESECVVKVIPETGYNAGIPNYATFILTDNITISATEAVIKKFVLTVNPSTNGIVSVNEQTNTSFIFNYGTQITLKAVPNSRYRLKSMRIDLINTDLTNPYTFIITQDVNVTAIFEVDLPLSDSELMSQNCNVGSIKYNGFTAPFGVKVVKVYHRRNYGGNYTLQVTNTENGKVWFSELPMGGTKYIGVTPGKRYNLKIQTYNAACVIYCSTAINNHAVDNTDY